MDYDLNRGGNLAFALPLVWEYVDLGYNQYDIVGFSEFVGVSAMAIPKFDELSNPGIF
jgi:hypothetical protein